MGRATFSLIINQTESKAKTPLGDNAFLIPGYPSSKLRAETIVLGAHGATLANGRGECIFDIYPDFGRLGGTRVEGGGGVDDTI